MPYNVLVVDDSSFFQVRLKEVINEHPDLNVVGVAANGQEAIDLTLKLKPDIISMDYEMPLLDGVSAIKQIMVKNPVPIVMFSSMTYEGAKITLDALDAGAVDFMNKNFAEVSSDSASFKRRLHEKLLEFVKNTQTIAPAVEEKKVPSKPVEAVIRQNVPRVASQKKQNLRGKVKLVAIGASTGGPVALSEIIHRLPGNFPAPILIIQHMPENFTRAFAERLDRQSALNVKEAENGDRILPGHVYVAPGGKQMIIDRTGHSIKIISGDDRVNYRPCIDITLASAATFFSNSVLAVILTGMGADGKEGCRLLKEKGSTVWSQDRESCVVYGMPAAVANEKITDRVLPLSEFANNLNSDL